MVDWDGEKIVHGDFSNKYLNVKKKWYCSLVNLMVLKSRNSGIHQENLSFIFFHILGRWLVFGSLTFI